MDDDFDQRILDVGFSSGSKILVTSRSAMVLFNLLQDTSYVMPLQDLHMEEARQISIRSFNRNQAGQSPHIQLEDSDVDYVTQSYQFKGGYHPLAVSAVGMNLGKPAGDQWLASWKCKASSSNR